MLGEKLKKQMSYQIFLYPPPKKNKILGAEKVSHIGKSMILVFCPSQGICQKNKWN